MLEMPPQLVELALRQQGLLTRAQLRQAGIGDQPIATRIKRGLWRAITSRVISTSPLPLTRSQELWVASLHYPRAALTGIAALAFDDLDVGHSTRIDILTARGTKAVPHPAWTLHTSTKLPSNVLGHPRRTLRPVSLLNAMA